MREEQKKREQKERYPDLPDIQFQILEGLPTEHIGDGATLNGISQRAGIPPHVAAVHLDELERLKVARHRIHNTSVGNITAWYRTIEGDKTVYAKSLAGEEGKKTAYKHTDLPKEQHEALAMIAEATGQGTIDEGEIGQRLGKSPAFARHILSLLRDAGMATDEDTPGEAIATEDFDYSPWRLLRKGEEYLAERDLL